MMCMQNLRFPSHAKRARQEKVWAPLRPAHFRPHEKRGLLKQSVPNRVQTLPRPGAEPQGSHPSALRREDKALFSRICSRRWVPEIHHQIAVCVRISRIGVRTRGIDPFVANSTDPKWAGWHRERRRCRFQLANFIVVICHKFSVSRGDLREEGRTSRVLAMKGV